MKKIINLFSIFLVLLFVFSSIPVCAKDKAPTKELIESHELKIPNDIGAANARKAAEYINGIVIKPGEVFSYNTIVGQRTKARGFTYGWMPKLSNGKIVGHYKALGAGVCRTSTAIYQAARDAKMEIIERHSHGFTVTYAKKGDDAAVNWGNGKGKSGWLDNRFKNNKDYSIMIECSVTKDCIAIVKIYKIN